MATSTTLNTPLDDLKDLAHEIRQTRDLVLDSLSAHGIDYDYEDEILEGLAKFAIETLGKYVPGLRYGSDGLAICETPEAFRAARTYDDGTPLVETITFPDVDGLMFSYRPRHDKPRTEFMEWARAEADRHKADRHARTALAGEEGSGIGVELVGSPDEQFHAFVIDGDASSSTTLTREQVIELHAGLERILATQALQESDTGDDQDDDACPPISA